MAGSPLKMVLPKDYTLIISRTALVPGQAPEPALDGLFLNYLRARANWWRLHG